MPPRKPRKRSIDPREELREKEPRPVYALDGEETALLDEFLRELRDLAVPPGARDFNYEVHQGKDVTLARVLDSASTLPAFAPRRMVVVTQADKLLTPPEPLLRYLEAPSPTTVLVFVAEKFDARSKVYKAFQKAGAALRFSRPKPSEMPELVRARARRRGVKIDAGAVRMLIDAVGADLGAVDRSLELLDLYRGPGVDRPIDVDDVAAVVMSVKEESVFELVDAIGAGQRASALELLYRITVIQREPALRVLALVARHYRLLLWTRELVERRASPGEMASALQLPPFVVDKLRRQAADLSLERLVKAHAAIKARDRQLKGGRLSGARALEGLALELMSAPS